MVEHFVEPELRSVRAVGIAGGQGDEPDATLVAGCEELSRERGARGADKNHVGGEDIETVEHVAPADESRDDDVAVLDDVGKQAVLRRRVQREREPGHQRPLDRAGTKSIVSPLASASSSAATLSRGTRSSTDGPAESTMPSDCWMPAISAAGMSTDGGS
jgi:hypothetical protein